MIAPTCQPEYVSTSVWVTEPSQELPTATHAVELLHATALSELLRAPVGFGVGWIDQLVPSHRSASVDAGRPFRLVDQSPTASQAGELHDTPNRFKKRGFTRVSYVYIVDLESPFLRVTT